MHRAGTLKIALAGMMASGKTTVGRNLARILGVPFVDSDAEVAAAAGMSVAGCFAALGEDAFRKLERGVIARLLDGGGDFVMSLGGGAFMQPAVRALLAEKARSVFLRVDAEELVRRLEKTDIAKRPLLASSPDWRAKIATLLSERKNLYDEADIHFDANARDPAALARELAAILRKQP